MDPWFSSSSLGPSSLLDFEEASRSWEKASGFRERRECVFVRTEETSRGMMVLLEPQVHLQKEVGLAGAHFSPLLVASRILS